MAALHSHIQDELAPAKTRLLRQKDFPGSTLIGSAVALGIAAALSSRHRYTKSSKPSSRCNRADNRRNYALEERALLGLRLLCGPALPLRIRNALPCFWAQHTLLAPQARQARRLDRCANRKFCRGLGRVSQQRANLSQPGDFRIKLGENGINGHISSISHFEGLFFTYLTSFLDLFAEKGTISVWLPRRSILICLLEHIECFFLLSLVRNEPLAVELILNAG